ncbi:MAG: nuclear transport factor 2 family protein [Ilumatobacteraceae bacterium]
MNDIEPVIESVIDSYLEAYSEPDEDRRRDLIVGAFATDASLADPPFVAAGHDELHATFGAVQAQFPGHRFVRTSPIDQHHDRARYTWALQLDDGAPVMEGMDIVAFADGKIVDVTGFFGHVPSA